MKKAIRKIIYIYHKLNTTINILLLNDCIDAELRKKLMKRMQNHARLAYRYAE